MEARLAGRAEAERPGDPGPAAPDVSEAALAWSGSPAGDEVPSELADSAEAAYLAETRGSEEAAVTAPAVKMEEADTKPLPPLDELVARIPPEVRASLDDLFRAKFIAVRRVPRTALKS